MCFVLFVVYKNSGIMATFYETINFGQLLFSAISVVNKNALERISNGNASEEIYILTVRPVGQHVFVNGIRVIYGS